MPEETGREVAREREIRRDPWASGVYVLWSHRPRAVRPPAPLQRPIVPSGDSVRRMRENARGESPAAAVERESVAAIERERIAASERERIAAIERERIAAVGQPVAAEVPVAARPGALARRMMQFAAPGNAVAAAPQRDSAGFVREVTRWPRVDARPPLLTGRPLELPDAEAWRSVQACLFGHVDRASCAGERARLAERPVFLDVESTGLGHGAGTVAFVIGLATVEDGAWQVEQWVLSRLSAEAAMLADLQARLAALGGLLVTFNGASFDLPLLRGRLRRCGLTSEALGGPHLDLLPVARRLWRGRGPDCRLGTLERLHLGARREGDIEGRAIPEVFWTALRQPDDEAAQHSLRRVVAHNLVDVLTMPALAQVMARTVVAPGDLELIRRAADHLTAIGRRGRPRAAIGPPKAGQEAPGRAGELELRLVGMTPGMAPEPLLRPAGPLLR